MPLCRFLGFKMKKSTIIFITSAFFMHNFGMENPKHIQEHVAVTKKVGDGPIFLTIKNKTNKGYLIDTKAKMKELIRGANASPMGIIKPKRQLTLSELEWYKGHSAIMHPAVMGYSVKYLNIVALNSETTVKDIVRYAAQIELRYGVQPGNISFYFFKAILQLQNQNEPIEICSLLLPAEQSQAASFVIHVTLDGEDLEKSYIDLSAGM